MKQSRHHLVEVIAQRTMKVRDTKKLAQEMAAYLLFEHQTANLESLVRDILQYRAEHGDLEVTAVSAHEFNHQVEADIRKLLKQTHPDARTVDINHELDPTVVGGLRLDLANEQLDLTTRGKLNKFKRLTGAGKE